MTRAVAVALAALAAAAPAAAYIEALYPLSQFISESDVIAEAVVDKVDPIHRTCVLKIVRTLKGRCGYDSVRLNIGAGHDWHPEAVLRHLPVGAPAVVFATAERRAEIYVNRFFLQVYGDSAAPAEKAWWTFTHIEVRCNRTFNGSVDELLRLVADIRAGKTQAPETDAKVPPIRRADVAALPLWNEPVTDPSTLPSPFARRDPNRKPRYRDPENPAGLSPGMTVDLFEGEWASIPDFAPLRPAASGIASRIDLSALRRDDRFALRFTGYLDVPRDGTYVFSTTSDDGSRLSIGSQEVVNNDGLHGAEEKSGEIALRAGRHAITVVYFENGGGETLETSWEGPGLPKQPIPASALLRVPAP